MVLQQEPQRAHVFGECRGGGGGERVSVEILCDSGYFYGSFADVVRGFHIKQHDYLIHVLHFSFLLPQMSASSLPLLALCLEGTSAR